MEQWLKVDGYAMVRIAGRRLERRAGDPPTSMVFIGNDMVVRIYIPDQPVTGREGRLVMRSDRTV